MPGHDEVEMDFNALFVTEQIRTGADGVHRGADGREYDAIDVNGELSYAAREPGRLPVEVNPGSERAERAVRRFHEAARDAAAWHLPTLAWATLGAYSAGLTDAELGAVARALLDAEVEAWAMMPTAAKRGGSR